MQEMEKPSLLSSRLCRTYPGRPAIVGNGKSCTYEEMHRGIASLSKKLREILRAVSDFHTDYSEGRPVYCMDFLYENEVNIQEFLMKDKKEENQNV